jgi:hypothetical protein
LNSICIILVLRNEEETLIYIPEPVSINAKPAARAAKRRLEETKETKNELLYAVQRPNLAMWLNVLQIFITDLQAIEGSIPLESVSKYVA